MYEKISIKNEVSNFTKYIHCFPKSHFYWVTVFKRKAIPLLQNKKWKNKAVWSIQESAAFTRRRARHTRTLNEVEAAPQLWPGEEAEYGKPADTKTDVQYSYYYQ